MPVIALDATGVPKSVLVEGGYEFCGLNSQEYERTPEEMVTGLRRLNALMALLAKRGIDLSYEFPTYGQGLLEEPSGIPDDAVEPVCALLAQRLAPGLGASLTPDAVSVLATARSDLFANYAAAPPARTPAHRQQSLGVRHQTFFRETIDLGDNDPGDLAGIVG